MLPEPGRSEQALNAAFVGASRRALLRQALQAGCVALIVLASAQLGFRPSGRVLAGLVPAVTLLIAASLWSRRQTRRSRALAEVIESGNPRLKNLVITAEELLRHPERAPDWVRARVLDDASETLRNMDMSSVWPVRRLAAGTAAAAVVAATAFLAVPPRNSATAGVPAPISGETNAEVAIEVRLTPPPYTRKPVVQVRNPERLEAIEGTVARVAVANGRDVRVRLGARPLSVVPSAGMSIVEETLTDSGYLAVEADGPDTPARLIAVTVVPDRTPLVRIDQPARDLLLPDAKSSVQVSGTALDDIAIGALTLHYTKVSGAGEQIDFVEGELPLQIARESQQQWRARGTIALPSLGLEAGDSLVYRLVARDARAGDAGASASDTYFVEIAGPGQVPLEGVEMPPEQERYALSQQMVVVKIKRLRERERALSAAALEEESSAIAAEQRSVRANFVFLMGGHVEDEEEEAEQEHEIQEGRLENSSRRELSRAVSHMTAAEQGLTARDTASALRAATLAVEALQRAFGRNRYILRTLASRTKLDPARRLTGVREDVERGARSVEPAGGDPDARRARELLAQFLAVATQLPSGGSARPLARLSEIAEAALAVKPADRGWQETSSAVVRLRDQMAAGGDEARIRDGVRDVVRRLIEQGKRTLPTVTAPAGDLERIESALAAGGRGR